MNKRQAKKAFKKKYGMNPGEAAKLLNETDFTKVMQQVTEAINDFAKKLPEILQKRHRKLNLEWKFVRLN